MWFFCFGDFFIGVFAGSPVQILFCSRKDSTSGHTALAGLELHLCFGSYHLCELVAVQTVLSDV